MIQARLCSLLLCLAVVVMPTYTGWAKPPVPPAEGEPISVAERAFAVTHDGYTGYQGSKWHDQKWTFYTYAGLWATGELPKQGDPEAWARARIAKEVVGVEGMTVQRGVFARAAAAANAEHEAKVIFRHDPKAARPRIEWDNGIVVVGKSPDVLGDLSPMILKAIDVAANYDLHPGWLTGSFFRTIASPTENPLRAAAVAKSLNCDWIIWARGQNDDLTSAYARRSLDAVATKDHDPMLMLAGQQIHRPAWHDTKQGWSILIIDSKNKFDRQNSTKELKYYVDKARDGGGLVFASADTWRKASQIAKVRNLKKPFVFDGMDGVDSELCKTVPFLGGGDRSRPRGEKETGGPSSMVVLTPHGEKLTRKTLFDGIRAKRAFHVSGGTDFKGPERLVQAMGLLLLSGDYMKDQFHNDIVVHAKVEGWNKLTVTVTNRGEVPFTGGLSATTGTATEKPFGFAGLPNTFTLKAGSKAVFTAKIAHGTDVSGKDVAVLVSVNDKAGKPYKRALAHVRFPRAVRGYQTLYLPPGKYKIPFTIWNATNAAKVPYGTLQEMKKGNLDPLAAGTAEIAPRTSGRVELRMTLREGEYDFTLQALGQKATTHVVVQHQKGGKTKHWLEDMNKDGKKELFFENDHVKGVFLMQGGRLIRYWNKANGDNVFCEIWPENPPNRKKEADGSFWPYGGLEEFITYPKIHAHTWFQYKIVRDDDQAFAVEMTAEVHGQKIKKTYTVYAGSGLLELRYELDFTDPTVHMVGVNPILALGEVADAHDVSIIPTKDGIVRHRYDPDRMHGGSYFSNEGWVAHVDEREKSALIETYPLADTLMMHLWNNTPQNSATHYYYTELQPWFLVDHTTTTYYTTYFYPHVGTWQEGLKKLKQIGITP